MKVRLGIVHYDGDAGPAVVIASSLDATDQPYDWFMADWEDKWLNLDEGRFALVDIEIADEDIEVFLGPKVPSLGRMTAEPTDWSSEIYEVARRDPST